MDAIFPRSDRRQKVKEFAILLGVRVKILAIKAWLVWIIIGFVLSLIAFFFSSKIAIIGLTFFSLVSWTANKFSKELPIETVGQLAKKISREHYSRVRRYAGTVNKKEITRIIQEVFIEDWGINRDDLGRQSSLRWA